MTSVLDEVFGPKEPPPDLGTSKTPDERLLAALQGGSEWHCEDRIKPALDAFFECWPGHRPRSPLVRRSHYPAARALTDEVGEMEVGAFIRWAATTLQGKRDLTIKNCRSLLFLVPEWAKREVGPEWYRKPCPKCCTFHPPGPKCPEEMEAEDD